jgi:hypothetical protein
MVLLNAVHWLVLTPQRSSLTWIHKEARHFIPFGIERAIIWISANPNIFWNIFGKGKYKLSLTRTTSILRI